MRKFRLEILVPLAVSGLALGCSQTSSVSDGVAVAALSHSNTAIAVMKTGMAEQSCTTAIITLGKRAGDTFEPVQTVRVGKNVADWIDTHDVAQVELAAGEYHVLDWVCQERSGNMIFNKSVGKKEGGFWGIGGTYKRSMGSFTLAAGEIVNVGYLRFVPIGMSGAISIDVEDLPPKSREALQKEKPKLVAQMVTRLMKVEQKPMTAETLKAMCDLLKAMSEVTKDQQPLPEKCRGLTATGPAPARAAGKPATAASINTTAARAASEGR